MLKLFLIASAFIIVPFWALMIASGASLIGRWLDNREMLKLFLIASVFIVVPFWAILHGLHIL